MLEAKYLRIGNFLNHNTRGVIEILGITPYCGDYKIDTKNGWVFLKNCSSIDLDDLWLSQLGVKFNGGFRELTIEDIRISITFYDAYIIKIESNDNTDRYNITIWDYPKVHELQNIVAITGKELTIKTE